MQLPNPLQMPFSIEIIPRLAIGRQRRTLLPAEPRKPPDRCPIPLPLSLGKGPLRQVFFPIHALLPSPVTYAFAGSLPLTHNTASYCQVPGPGNVLCTTKPGSSPPGTPTLIPTVKSAHGHAPELNPVPNLPPVTEPFECNLLPSCSLYPFLAFFSNKTRPEPFWACLGAILLIC